MRTKPEAGPCRDCGVAIGQPHTPYCDVPRCQVCGWQRLQCEMEHQHPTEVPVIWTGQWPGELECQELGLWSKWTDHGWEKCDKDDPDAGEDLNALAELHALGKLVWDSQVQRLVLP